MNFRQFSAMPVENFARRIRQDGRIVIFHHIPKTAGSSLTRELLLTLPPYKNVHIGKDGHSLDRTKSDPMANAIQSFLAEEPARRFRSASGHFFPRHLKTIQTALPYAAVFTVLRHPVDRFISDYRYSRTPSHPPHMQFIARYPTMEDYAADPQSGNKMWKMMGGRDASSEEEITKLFNRYMFIGLVEDLTLHFEFLTALFGCPKTIETRRNVTQESANNKVELTDTLRAQIEAANEHDMALYNLVQSKLASKREEMQAFVAQRRAEFLGVSSK